LRNVIRCLILPSLILILNTSSYGDVKTADFEGAGGLTGLNQFNNKTTPGFSQAGMFFNNSYDTTYGSWSGFTVSSMVDNVPVTTNDYLHQYGAYAPINASKGTGGQGSADYAVVYNGSVGDAYVNLPDLYNPLSMQVTNSIYTASSILNGDSFARPFHSGDYLRLDVIGFAGANATGAQTGTTSIYLADYRNGASILLSDWTTLSLTPLGNARSIGFSMTTTDVGTFGPNTPLSFDIDNLSISSQAAVPEPTEMALVGMMIGAAAIYRRWRGTR